MKFFYTPITLFLLLFSLSVKAQYCGTDERNEMLKSTDASYKSNVEKNKQDWIQYQQMKHLSRLVIDNNDTVYEIPVVFHIVHTGGAIGTQYNPTDAQLISLIDYVNQSYQAIWSSYPDTNSGGVYVPFKFVIAKRDPNCDSTTGILRVDGSSLPNYTTNGIGTGGAPDVSVKNLSRWPNTEYYNIWVVNYIDGPTGSTAGYAYYPGAGPLVDGTVILADYSVSGSITLVHELGHAMGLPHTFEGDNNGTTCPTNNNCQVDGDAICDTEPHQRGVSCSMTINPCTGTSFNNTEKNFMSYTSGNCRNRFTAGQRERMLFSLINNRTLLMHSIGAIAPPAPAVTASCIPTILNTGSTLNAGVTEVQLKNIHSISGGYTADGNQVYIDNFCTGNTELYLDTVYDLVVKTGAQVENVKVYLDLDNDGSFNDPGEIIFSSTGTVANETHTGTVTIPSSSSAVTCMPLRMRVISDVASASAFTSCSQLSDGQAEDFIVTLKPGTGATIINNFSAGGNPSCKDSLIEFTAVTDGIPATSTITWRVNGSAVVTGNLYGNNGFQDGDVIQSYAVINNPTCNTPDTIWSPTTTIHIQSGPVAPFISFVGNMLVANSAPVQWYGPNGPIPGATSSSYHPPTEGYYYAVVTSDSCPSAPSNILLVSLLDIKKQFVQPFSIYPNPANSAVNIAWGSNVNATIALYNSIGQMVYTTDVVNQKEYLLNTAQYPVGIYLMQLKYADGGADVVRLTISH